MTFCQNNNCFIKNCKLLIIEAWEVNTYFFINDLKKKTVTQSWFIYNKKKCQNESLSLDHVVHFISIEICKDSFYFISLIRVQWNPLTREFHVSNATYLTQVTWLTLIRHNIDCGYLLSPVFQFSDGYLYCFNLRITLINHVSAILFFRFVNCEFKIRYFSR